MMTLIVDLKTINDPLMTIDSVLDDIDSQKQHFQLLSFYHTTNTYTIK